MKTAITLCQVPEAKAGPFVFHGPLEESYGLCRDLGFDAVELFLPGPDAVPVAEIQALGERFGLPVAAVGTGAGMVKHGLSLTDPDAGKRGEAREFVAAMVRFGGALGAPAILGSMQGRWGGEVAREQALEWLAEALREAGAVAAESGVPFIYEPLNRYETNLFNHLGAARAWLDEESVANVVLLADLFHMNIEEPDMATALREAGDRLGHVHFADSNRHAVGFGHSDLAPAMKTLREMNYDGYVSAEIFPLPDAGTAARRTLESFRSLTES